MDKYSIVIPCFNESLNILRLFSEVDKYIVKNTCLEVIFVDDGSTDNTKILLQQFKDTHNNSISVISYPENKGKGFAVRTGVLSARGNWIIILDADLAVSLDHIEKLKPLIALGNEVIVGNRRRKDAHILVRQSFIRENFGKVYTMIAQIVTGVKVDDFTCGFKCFSESSARRIFSVSRIDRWAYDTEIFYLIKKYNIKWSEIGVAWKDGDDTKVRIVRDTLQSFWDTLRIPFLHNN